MSAPRSDEALSLAEAADLLGVHYMTAYRYVRTGLLVAHRDSGRWVVARSEVDRLLAERAAERSDAGPAPSTRRRADRAPRLADRLVAGDEGGSWRIVQDARAGGLDLDDILVGVVCAALRIVGDRWEAGTVSIAEEHRATVVAMRIISRLGEAATRRGRPRGTVLLATTPGDRHGLPTAVVADLLRSRGIAVVDLGADTPPSEVASAAAGTHDLRAVGLCATTSLDAGRESDLRATIALVHEASPVPVLLGGAAIDGPAHAADLGADRWTADAPALVDAVVGPQASEGGDR